MEELSFLNAIELLAGFQAFLFAIYLFFKKEGNQLSNYFIAIFIILLAYNVLDFFANRFIDEFSGYLATFLQLTLFAAPAVLYFHIKTALYTDYKLVKRDILHLLPLVLIYLVSIPVIHKESISGEELKGVSIAYYAYLYLSLFIYLYFSYKEFKSHKSVFLENYSNSDLKRYRYIKNLILIVLVLFVLSFINFLFRYAYQVESFSFAPYVVIITLLMLFSWLIYNGLKSPELFIDKRFAQPLANNKMKYKEGKTPLISSEEVKRQVVVVEDFMKNEEPFLDASLTLHSLAGKTEIPAKDLSLLINHHLSKHFFDFVNEYRIEKAKELLSSPDRKEYTVLEILYEVGFNSKSSFNTAFKKHCGLTPTEYRKSQSTA